MYGKATRCFPGPIIYRSRQWRYIETSKAANVADPHSGPSPLRSTLSPVLFLSGPSQFLCGLYQQYSGNTAVDSSGCLHPPAIFFAFDGSSASSPSPYNRLSRPHSLYESIRLTQSSCSLGTWWSASATRAQGALHQIHRYLVYKPFWRCRAFLSRSLRCVAPAEPRRCLARWCRREACSMGD